MWKQRIRASALALAVGAGLTLSTTAATAAAAETDLPAPTQTGPVTVQSGPATLVGVRVGRHDRYDRTVFDFTGGTPSYQVAYGVLRDQGRGQVVPVNGAATLVVVFSGLTQSSNPANRVLNPEFPTLRQVKSGGLFEGYAGFGLGLRDRVGFRVFTLHNPDRVVIDVAHQPVQAFQTTTFTSAGSAAEALVNSVRAARHPGYDRVVFDMQGNDLPRVAVGYLGSGSTIRVTFTGLGSATLSPHASFSGPRTYTFGLPVLRTLAFTVVGAGIMTADVGTAGRNGFRVLLLQNPVRVAVDVQRLG